MYSALLCVLGSSVSAPPRPKLGSMSNRALLVNNLLSSARYAGIRVVFAVGMTPSVGGIDQRKAARETTQSIRSSLGRGIF